VYRAADGRYLVISDAHFWKSAVYLLPLKNGGCLGVRYSSATVSLKMLTPRRLAHWSLRKRPLIHMIGASFMQPSVLIGDFPAKSRSGLATYN
jgi:hypothetical protein